MARGARRRAARARSRLSRIFWRGRFIDYPLRLADVVRKVGPVELARCSASYARRRDAPAPARRRRRSRSGSARASAAACTSSSSRRTPRRSGACPARRSAPSGPRSASARCRSRASCARRVLNDGGEVHSLIEQFHYPRLGPGPDVGGDGGRDRRRRRRAAARLAGHAHRARGRARARPSTPAASALAVEHVISSLPLRDVVAIADPPPPPRRARRRRAACATATSSRSRSSSSGEDLFPDNWIYVHDPDVRVGRIQNFRAWSEAMVPDAGRTCVGLEYFCFEGDELWNATDAELVARATRELAQIGLADAGRVDGGLRRARPEGLSDLRRALRGARADRPRVARRGSRTSSRSAATGCTATTTPTTRC